MYKVVEKFVSINGEGRWAGELAVFIRLAYCNLECSYCDTMWANKEGVDYTPMTKDEIRDYILGTGVERITLTGGEPLLDPKVKDLLQYLVDTTSVNIEIETNGSVDIKPFALSERISFTLDYKGPSSGMEGLMKVDNYNLLREWDTVKFVLGSKEDLEKAKAIIEEHRLLDKAKVYFSPSYDKLESKDIVEFMIENNLNKVKMQLQLHKYIWNPDEKGV